jgi:hypothetical protein
MTQGTTRDSIRGTTRGATRGTTSHHVQLRNEQFVLGLDENQHNEQLVNKQSVQKLAENRYNERFVRRLADTRNEPTIKGQRGNGVSQRQIKLVIKRTVIRTGV